jgi:hypothetical protein
MPGMGELHYGIFAVDGKSPHIARGQEFSVVPGKNTEILACYAENSRPAMAMRRFSSWISVYSGAPWGITPELLNRLARLNGTYTAAPAGQSIFMNDRFIVLHTLKSVNGFEITLPPGTTQAVLAETGTNIPVENHCISLDLTAGNTYWILLKK